MEPGRGPVRITLDTSAINARGSLAEMNLIERWHAEGRVEIHTPPPVHQEIDNHRDPKGRALYAEKAAAFGGAAPAEEAPPPGAFLTPEEAATTLFPHTRPEERTESQLRDAELVSEHHRLGRDVLITLNTRHFIRAGRRERLSERGIRVMTPAEFVADATGRLGWPAGEGNGGRAPDRASA